VVCLIDTAAKPEGSVWQRQCQKQHQSQKLQKNRQHPKGGTSSNYASGTPSPAARKNIIRKKYRSSCNRNW
jgi:hypothetical protein